MKCAICRDAEASQKHHVCYDPEILVEVCVSCHKLLHKNKHGVGKGRNDNPPKIIEKEKPVFINGSLTKSVIGDFGIPYIHSFEKGELLDWLICVNRDAGCNGTTFHIFHEKSSGRFFCRCPHCGWDFEFVGDIDAEK